jgi:hypothetical protein
MNEFQLTPTNILGRHSMNVSESAYLTRYDPTFLESILTGKSCQVPADFFVRIRQRPRPWSGTEGRIGALAGVWDRALELVP